MSIGHLISISKIEKVEKKRMNFLILLIQSMYFFNVNLQFSWNEMTKRAHILLFYAGFCVTWQNVFENSRNSICVASILILSKYKQKTSWARLSMDIFMKKKQAGKLASNKLASSNFLVLKLQYHSR